MSSNKKKIRILFLLTDLNKNGATLSTLTTINNLDKNKFESKLFVINWKKRKLGVDAWDSIIAQLDIIYGFRKGHKQFLSYPLFSYRLIKLSLNSDIIFGGIEMAPTFLAAAFGKLSRRPSIAFVRNSLPELLLELPPIYTRLTQYFYPMLTKVIAISGGIKKNLEILIPKLTGRISTVYVPIDQQKVRIKMDEFNHEIEAYKPYLFAAGRLQPQKGFDLLIKSFAIARKKGVNQKLIIAGEGKQRLKLEKSIKELNLQDEVKLVGFQSNPYVWMKHADIFVSSSRYEGFCRVIAESLAVGTPVVSTNCPDGPLEVLDNGNCGVLVENENIEALSQGIVKLANNQELQKELVERGLIHVKKFSVEASVSSVESILNNMI